MARSDVVFPGDPLGAAEEFVPGPGTYEEDGAVFAARIGIADLDRGEFEASVRPGTTIPALLQPDDLVIGRVIGLRKSFAIVRIEAKADEPTRPLNVGSNATLHVAKISRDYLERIEDAFRIGDVVRAKVLEAKPAVQLTTKASELGVLLARCPRCRHEMEGKGHGLICPSCEWKSSAKLAVDYGEGFLLPPDDIDDRERARHAEHKRAGIEFRGPPRPRMSEDDYGPRGGGRGGGRRGGDRGRGGGRGGGRPQRTMTTVTCSACGKKAEVPFKPTGDRPVYCSSCFEERGGGGKR